MEGFGIARHEPNREERTKSRSSGSKVEGVEERRARNVRKLVYLEVHRLLRLWAVYSVRRASQLLEYLS